MRTRQCPPFLSVLLLAACTFNNPSALRARDPAALPLDGFRASFTVLFSSENPELSLRPAGVPGVSYNVPTWQVSDAARSSTAKVERDLTQAGDGFDEAILDGAMRQRAHNLFDAGQRIDLDALSFDAQTGICRFPENAYVELSASYEAASEDGFPTLRFTALRKMDGWLSIGYRGSPKVTDSEAAEAWQPLIWTQRRFPALPYLTPAHMCTLPGSFVRTGQTLYGVMADPSELPFEPLPVFSNSGFGVALRTSDAFLSPMIFAPMLGGSGSYGKAGEEIHFSIRLVRLDCDVTQAFETVARRLFDFRDRRHNALGPLDAVLERMTDYGMSDYSYWIASLRGCGYSTDVPGAVKNVSALNPLELALLSQRRDLFEERAKPIMEYLLSREKFLFSLDPEQKIQSPSRALKGPSAPVSELAALDVISHNASPVFKELAIDSYARNRVLNLNEQSIGRTWWNALSLYRASGEAHWLETAMMGADAYLATHVDVAADSFEDEQSQGFFFWPGFVPRWIDLLLLYEASGETRYLEAAHRGARLSTLFVWMCPMVPDGEILVNKGNKAPVYAYLGKRGYPAMDAPEQSVPAWRLSEIGLTPESSGTATGHRGIFMTHYAPWMLRLAALTNDSFLHDIARSAVIGRYRNFPGYHINTARTNVYEQEDYPLRRHEQMSYNSMHYNHVWPMASMLVDYLISDAWARSAGAIDFPSEYIEGYAYLQSRFYGHDKGRIHDLKDMQLWLPGGLVDAGSPELNSFAAYNRDGVAVVLSNQGFDTVNTTLLLNGKLFARLDDGSTLRCWQGNNPVADSRWSAEGVAISVPAKGLAVVFIEGALPEHGWMPGEGGAVARSGVVALEPGEARAMLLSLGSTETWVYVHLREDDSLWRSVRLEITQGASIHVLDDDTFPFEFSMPVDPEAGPVSIRLNAEGNDGTKSQGEAVQLRFAN